MDEVKVDIISKGVKLRSVYKLFREKVEKFQLIPVEDNVQQKFDIKPYQLRMLSCNVPDYWLITMEAESGMTGFGLYKVLLLTEDICLADFDRRGVPLLRIAGVHVVACLPFWIYLTEEFLKKYSMYVTDIDRGLAECLLRWAMWVKLPSEKTVRGKYLRDVMELTSSWNFSSILAAVDKAEGSNVVRVE
jgi:hypothetical protein